MEFVSVGLEGLLHKDYVYHDKEKRVSKSKNILVLKDIHNSYRIIYIDDLGNWVGGLQIVTKPNIAIASNIYVAESSRRQGISGKLIAKAYKLFPYMEFSTNTNENSDGMIKKYSK